MPALRVAVVTESFLPNVNGVTTSVCRVLDHLRLRGDQAVVVCPGPAPQEYAGFPVVAVPALNYRQFPVGLPTRLVQRTLEDFSPDVVHAASPFVLGAAGVFAARRLQVPAVAIYQTDVAGYARRHHVGPAAGTAWRWLRRVHAAADLTLAPSSCALRDLHAHGITWTALWGRGVDTVLYRPDRRSGGHARALRARLAPRDEVLVGYVGRLAPEKRVERLAAIADLPGTVTVVVGDGPSRAAVERALPGAVFLGRLDGPELADAYAALDLFVHTGTEETFGQTLQEAMASGVPVVAPAAGGPLDLVRPGVQGELYAPDDDQQLRAVVGRLVTDPAQRHRLGRTGRADMLPRSWHALGEDLVEHYYATMNRRSTVPGRPAAA